MIEFNQSSTVNPLLLLLFAIVSSATLNIIVQTFYTYLIAFKGKCVEFELYVILPTKTPDHIILEKENPYRILIRDWIDETCILEISSLKYCDGRIEKMEAADQVGFIVEI